MATVHIAGYGIEITHPDIQKCRSIADLKKLNIFTGGNEDAYKELAKELGLKVKPDKQTEDGTIESSEV